MGKIATSEKRKTSLRRRRNSRKIELKVSDFKEFGIKEEHPSEYLTNPHNIGKAILECLENNDPEGVMEVISIYLEAVNKTKVSKDAELHRQTVYSALKHRNPTVKTLAKLMHSYSHS